MIRLGFIHRQNLTDLTLQIEVEIRIEIAMGNFMTETRVIIN